MSLLREAEVGSGCGTCGFELWHPVTFMRISAVGLYDDERFPGRLLVVLGEHFEHLDQLPERTLAAFMSDVKDASTILREQLGADRVNVAVLGNEVSHVHAHVIPRRVSDPIPTRPPWEDPRAEAPMADRHRKVLLNELSSHFAASTRTSGYHSNFRSSTAGF